MYQYVCVKNCRAPVDSNSVIKEMDGHRCGKTTWM